LIHQLWTLKELHEALKASDDIKKGWYIEQGSSSPASVFLDEQGSKWVCWYEPQIKKAPPDYRAF
jgi:hypothetical protein